MKALPWLKNVLLASMIPVATLFGILWVDLKIEGELPGVVWGLAGGIITKSYDIAASILEMYNRLMSADIDKRKVYSRKPRATPAPKRKSTGGSK